MKNRIKAPSSIVIAVLTVITIIFWIGFEVFRIFTTKPAPVVPKEIIAPLSPTLDSGGLTRLQESVYLTESEIGDTIIKEVSVPEASPATPEPTPIGTESGEVTQ